MQESCNKGIKIILFLIFSFIFVSFFVSAGDYMDFLTKPYADSLYCSLNGCIISGDLNVIGNLTMTQSSNGSILPSYDDTYNLGSPELYWQYGYFTSLFENGYDVVNTNELSYISNCSISNSCDLITYDSELRYIGNCSETNCIIGWGNLTGIPQLGNTTKEIWNVIDNSTYLNILDQRYNETTYINGLKFGNTTSEIWLVVDNSTFAKISDISSLIDNNSIIRNWNTSWITLNQNYNTTEEIWNVVNNATFIPYTGATKNVDLGSYNLTINNSVLFVDSTSGNVGIGTTSPSSLIQIGSNIHIRANNTIFMTPQITGTSTVMVADSRAKTSTGSSFWYDHSESACSSQYDDGSLSTMCILGYFIGEYTGFYYENTTIPTNIVSANWSVHIDASGGIPYTFNLSCWDYSAENWHQINTSSFSWPTYPTPATSTFDIDNDDCLTGDELVIRQKTWCDNSPGIFIEYYEGWVGFTTQTTEPKIEVGTSTLQESRLWVNNGIGYSSFQECNERGTMTSNNYMAYGNGQTPLGMPVPLDGMVTWVAAMCSGTINSTDYITGFEIRVNGASQTCDTAAVNAQSTAGNPNAQVTTGCEVAFNGSDILTCTSITETGPVTECVCCYGGVYDAT